MMMTVMDTYMDTINDSDFPPVYWWLADAFIYLSKLYGTCGRCAFGWVQNIWEKYVMVLMDTLFQFFAQTRSCKLIYSFQWPMTTSGWLSEHEKVPPCDMNSTTLFSDQLWPQEQQWKNWQFDIKPHISRHVGTLYVFARTFTPIRPQIFCR